MTRVHKLLMLKIYLLAAILLGFISCDRAIAQSMELIAGRWSHDITGETLDIKQNFGGWEGQHSKLGLFSLTNSGQMKAGANLWMSGRGIAPGSIIDCHVFVSFNGSRAMTWNLRDGPAEYCFVGRFSKVSTNQEIQEELANEAALRKAKAARVAAEIAAQDAATALAKADAVRKVAEAAEAETTARRDKEKSEKAALDAAEAAKIEREALAIRIKSGPAELVGVEVVYFEKDSDNGNVAKALNNNKIAFTTRASENNQQTSILSCGPDVSLDAVKRIANALLDSNVPLRFITSAYYPQFRSRVTLESEAFTKKYAVLTKDQISNMTTCEAKGRDTGFVYFKNLCGYGNIDTYVLYRGSDDQWRIAFERDIQMGETRQVRNDDGSKNIISKQSAIWFYAETRDNRKSWGAASSENSVSRYIEQIGKTKYLRKNDGLSVTLSCSTN